jgi:hypothetical protein
MSEIDKNINIEAIKESPGWYCGEAEGYPFEAKVCDVRSEYGIDDGRVIKLFIHKKDGTGDLLADYQRGWDIYPHNKKTEAIANRLLTRLEKLPGLSE